MGTCFAVIEPTDNGEPYITLFREDDSVARSFPLDCSMDALEKFAFAIEAAVAEGRKCVEEGLQKTIDISADMR